jgi:type I restriction-modification system DNA methylase subunit/restriction endonuclease S subunit
MVKYVCKDCGNEFDQKSHYDRHLNKKIPCILKDKPLKEVINEAVKKQVSQTIKETDKQIIIKKKSVSDTDSSSESDNEDKKSKKTKNISKDKKSKIKSKKEEKEGEIDYSYLRLSTNEVIFELKENDNKKKSENKSNILKMIDKAHDILYNAENIEGEDALNDIMDFMFIKSIQPIISDKKEDGKIDLLDKKYYKDLCYEESDLDEIFSYFKDLSEITKKDIKQIRDLNNTNDIIRQIGDILKTHPITKQIFTENNFIKSKKSSTIKLLLNDVINKIKINELELNEDVIGEIYEHIINGYVKKGSKLGQFFTPRKLMKLLLSYKKDRIYEIIKKLDKKENIKVYDSCMGTAGWLVTGYNLLKNKYQNRLLLSGGEVKSSTFQYGLMNLLLTLKEFPHDVHCESSLTHINDIKHHIVLTNPPFQTDKKFDQIKDNFKHDEYTKTNKIKLDDIYELKDNNPPIQFLEMDLYKLEDNGLCIIILPYGELFFGSSYKDARKHFMKETSITDIVLFEGGIFTHTGIKTCALIFEKCKKGTTEINFIKANKECTQLTKITTVTTDDIDKEPVNSWYLRDYLKDEYIESLCTKMTNFEWAEFGEIFTLEKGKTQSSEIDDNINGIYPFISKAKNDNWKKTDKYTIDGKNLFIAKAANNVGRSEFFPIRYYEGKADFSNLLLKVNIKKKHEDKIILKFYYYYLNNIMHWLEIAYEKGSCNQSLDEKNFNRMKIPIPTLEEQELIIKDVMEFELSHKNIQIAIESNDKMKLKYMEYMIRNSNTRKLTTVMKLGNITKIKYGERVTKEKDGNTNGLYSVYGGGDETFNVDKFNREGKTCKISRFGMSEKNCVKLINEKYFLNDSGFTIESNNDKISNIFIWNYLNLIKTSIYNTGRDLAQRNIDIDKFKNIDIPIPTIEFQKYMESALDNFEKMDESLKILLKNNDEYMGTAFMNSMDEFGNPNTFNLKKLINGEECKDKSKKEDNSKSDEKPKKIIKTKKQISESESS